MLIIIFFATAAAKLIVSIICTQLNLDHLAPCGWEPVVISLNCLLLNMNSTNETLLFDRFLIMYDLCVFTCIIFIFVFHCTHVRMSYVLNSYLLTWRDTGQEYMKVISLRSRSKEQKRSKIETLIGHNWFYNTLNHEVGA